MQTATLSRGMVTRRLRNGAAKPKILLQSTQTATSHLGTRHTRQTTSNILTQVLPKKLKRIRPNDDDSDLFMRAWFGCQCTRKEVLPLLKQFKKIAHQNGALGGHPQKLSRERILVIHLVILNLIVDGAFMLLRSSSSIDLLFDAPDARTQTVGTEG